MGELHLEVIVDRNAARVRRQRQRRPAQVAYREALTRAVKAEGAFCATDRWRGQYGVVELVDGSRASVAPVSCSRTRRWRLGAERIRRPDRAGVKEALGGGPVGGYPVMDVLVRL
jgi:elongation factor G